MEKTRSTELGRSTGRKSFLLLLGLGLASVVGCANHPCREPRAPELDHTIKKEPDKNAATVSGAKGASETVAGSVSGSAPVAPDVAPAHVRIYKPDGSRQCEKRAGAPVDVMERELAGFVIHAREKRKDGLMHIQVCGSPSGMINLYEVDLTFLKQGEQRGFKRWEE